MLNIINAFVASGGWVPMRSGAENHQPKPKAVEHPKGLPYPQSSHKRPRQKPVPGTRHTEARSSVEY